MTPYEFYHKMLEIADNLDKEAKHTEADDLLCAVLTELGYGAGVKVFHEMEKWYA
jgi:hypothetical protein